MTKYIVVTGGVLSGLGKGLAAASIGKLLSPKYKIVPIKCDGYLNVDPGTMNPVEHGEVYVLEDGCEVDMDFGHYERYLGINCKREWNLTMGKVYERIRERERRGDYLGHTVEMIPDVTDLIIDWWQETAKREKADVILLEIGGTVGDMENELYLEAVSRLRRKVGRGNLMLVHVTYVPVLFGSGELKSKPTQHSISLLGKLGIIPDMVIGRCSKPLTDMIKRKIAEECDMDQSHVVTGQDTKNLFEIPKLFAKEGVGKVVKKVLGLQLRNDRDIDKYEKFVKTMEDGKKVLRIAICGKYTGINDSYASVISAIKLAGAEIGVKCDVQLIETTNIEEGLSNVAEELKDFDGVIVPGGFGTRGVEGKIEVIKYCREHDIPYLGLCYGLQLAVVEFARNVCGLSGAHTTEVNPRTKYPVVMILPEKKKLKDLGGTLRLGAYPAVLKKGSLVYDLYGRKNVSERHRHRYEVNPVFHATLQKHGMVFSGMSPDSRLVEYIELPKHRFFAATQAHPEFKYPAPLFQGFVKACDKK